MEMTWVLFCIFSNQWNTTRNVYNTTLLKLWWFLCERTLDELESYRISVKYQGSIRWIDIFNAYFIVGRKRPFKMIGPIMLTSCLLASKISWDVVASCSSVSSIKTLGQQHFIYLTVWPYHVGGRTGKLRNNTASIRLLKCNKHLSKVAFGYVIVCK